MHFYVLLTSAILAGCVNAQFSLHFGTNAPAPAQNSGKIVNFITNSLKNKNIVLRQDSWDPMDIRGSFPRTKNRYTDI